MLHSVLIRIIKHKFIISDRSVRCKKGVDVYKSNIKLHLFFRVSRFSVRYQAFERLWMRE